MEQFKLGSRYYYSRLSAEEQVIYREIYTAWNAGACSASVKLQGSGFSLPSGMDLHQLVTFIVDENPHLFHLETSQFEYCRVGSYISIRTNSIYSQEQYRAIYEKLIERVRKITHEARQHSTKIEQLRFLHHYLAENIEYNNQADNIRVRREAHTIVGALLNSSCVCDGYARAFRLLCDQLHISCIVALGESSINGSKGPHAWNIVKLDGRVYHVDVTWDSCLFNDGEPNYDFFFLRNDVVFSKTHCWSHSMYPPIIEDYPKNRPYFADEAAIEAFLCNEVMRGSLRVLIEFSKASTESEDISKVVSRTISRNRSVFSGIKNYEIQFFKFAQSALVVFYR